MAVIALFIDIARDTPFQRVSFPGISVDEESACNAGDLGSILGQEDLLEKEMANHSSILA